MFDAFSTTSIRFTNINNLKDFIIKVSRRSESGVGRGIKHQLDSISEPSQPDDWQLSTHPNHSQNPATAV